MLKRIYGKNNTQHEMILKTSKNDEFKTIMKNNQYTGNLAVMAKLMITTLTNFEQN